VLLVIAWGLSALFLSTDGAIVLSQPPILDSVLAKRYQVGGNIALEGGNHEQALDLLGKAWELEPDATTALLLARTSGAVGGHKSAESWIRKGLALSPFGKESHRLYHDFAVYAKPRPVETTKEKRSRFEAIKEKALASESLDHGRYAEALSALLAAWRHNPDNAGTAKLLYRAYHETKSFEDAAQWYQEWAQLTPDENNPPIPIPQRIQKPEVLKTPEFRYPKKARQAGVSGRVLIRMKVGIWGRVDSVIILKGHDLLREEIMRSMKDFRFKPAMTKAGEPVSVWVSQMIRFQ
jgi:TonB family protein